MSAPSPLFLGLDCSTQSMTGVVIKCEEGARQFEVVATRTFQFDERLPQYGTTKGVIMQDGHVEVPSLMLVEALDEILMELRVALENMGLKMSDIRAVSGSAQQHTSVFWRNAELWMPPGGKLSTYFKDKEVFAPERGRSWMDSSTSRECQALDKQVGGSQRMADISGSRSYERFTGIQLFALGALPQTKRVSIVSSMLTSVFHGAICGIDESDGSGMNLMDIRTRKWSNEILDAIESLNGPSKNLLLRYLGDEPIPCVKSVGQVAQYFVQEYSFSPSCAVIPFSGDNPCTLAGMGLSTLGDIGISLGTSSCLFAIGAPEEMKPSHDGHILINPVDSSTLMAMLCFKNGSLARENVRDRRANGSWETFSALMKSTPPGNNGIFGFYYLQPEITPVVPTESEKQCLSGIHGFTFDGQPVDLLKEPPEVEVRAIVEWQCLALLKYTIQLCGRTKFRRLVVGGGASVNLCILETLAHVFNAPVYVELNHVNTAALGGALRAQHGYECLKQNATQPYAPEISYQLKAVPDENIHEIYRKMLDGFNKLEDNAIKQQKQKYGQ